jgi:hypothetical protein
LLKNAVMAAVLGTGEAPVVVIQNRLALKESVRKGNENWVDMNIGTGEESPEYVFQS